MIASYTPFLAYQTGFVEVTATTTTSSTSTTGLKLCKLVSRDSNAKLRCKFKIVEAHMQFVDIPHISTYRIYHLWFLKNDISYVYIFFYSYIYIHKCWQSKQISRHQRHRAGCCCSESRRRITCRVCNLKSTATWDLKCAGRFFFVPIARSCQKLQRLHQGFCLCSRLRPETSPVSQTSSGLALRNCAGCIYLSKKLVCHIYLLHPCSLQKQLLWVCDRGSSLTWSWCLSPLRYCSNLRAMHILGKGQELGHEVSMRNSIESSSTGVKLPMIRVTPKLFWQVPTCIPVYDINVPNVDCLQF